MEQTWRRPTVSSARARTLLLVGGVLAVALVGAHVLRPAGGPGTATYLGVGVLASTLAWVGALHVPSGRRRPWALLALGITASALGDALHGGLGRAVAAVSLADVLCLGAYVCMASGLHLLNPERERGGLDVDALVDSLVAAVVGGLILWEAALADLVSDTDVAPLTRAVSAAYPIMDVVLLALIIRLAINRYRVETLALALLGAGTLCWLGSDFGSLVVGSAAGDRGLDVGWMAGSLVMGLAVLTAARSYEPAVSLPSEDLSASRRMWLVIWPLIVPVVVDVVGYLNGEHTNPVVLLVAMSSLIVLASIRAQRLIREVEAAHTRTELSKQRHRAIAAHSADAVLVLDAGGFITEGSGDVERLLGLDEDGLADLHVTDALAVSDPEAVHAILSMVAGAPAAGIEVELQISHRDGRDRWLATRAVNLLGDEAVAGIVLHLQDVTDKKRAEDALVHRAFHDALTGLANRALFVDRIEQALRRRSRSARSSAVLFLDIDGFKGVNDRFGHPAGDALLVEVAARLGQVTREVDTVGRLGGDEFAVLIEDTRRGEEAQTTAERILQSMTLPVELDGHLITLSVSMGLAVADPDATASSLLRNADIAMYRAKAGGKARVVTYSTQMGDEVSEALELETDLPAALDRGQLELYYQPVVELAGQRIVGFEALIRWNHPTLGLVSPDRFIPLCESSGLIVPIGRWVLESACAQAVEWQKLDGRRPLAMAVNLSARQLASDEIVAVVGETLDRTGLDPADLILEMTETALIEDPVDAGRRLAQLRRTGVRLAIDDFGTGYSSLSYLRQFPVDILKIDRSFVQTLTHEGHLPPIVRGLLDLGRTLELAMVAEGIELDVQRTSLTQERCELGQGFLFSRPLPRAEAQALLRSTEPAPQLT